MPFYLILQSTKAKYHIHLSAFAPPVWFQCFISFNHLLLIINASCNFLIYVSVGDKFKTTIEKFCRSNVGCGICFKSSSQNPATSPVDAEENGKSIPLLQVKNKHKNTDSVRTENGNFEHTQVNYFVVQGHPGQSGRN